MDEEKVKRRKLCRSRRDRWVAGVAGGMAEYWGIDASVIRLIWVILLLPGGLPGVVPYLICAIVIPKEPDGS